jgi:uncharacterized membrane protein YphA (DoxX/SURF4 family)
MGNTVNTTKQKIARILEIVVGAVFILSAWGKMTGVGSFGELIIRYGLPVFSIFAPAIVAMEVLCGLMLLFRLWPRLTACLVGSMLIAFTGAFFYANVFHGVKDCGCFGFLGPSAPAWLTYSRNGLLLAMCALILLWERKQQVGNANFRWICVAVLMVVSAFVIGTSFTVPSYYSGIFLKKHPLIDKAVKDTDIAKFVQTSPDSTYVLYVFSYDCSSCLDGINNAKQYDDRRIADRFLALPVTKDRDSVVHRAYGIDFDEVYVGEGLRGSVEIIPALIYIVHDTVKYVIQGTVPSVPLFRSNYLEPTK